MTGVSGAYVVFKRRKAVSACVWRGPAQHHMRSSAGTILGLRVCQHCIIPPASKTTWPADCHVSLCRRACFTELLAAVAIWQQLTLENSCLHTGCLAASASVADLEATALAMACITVFCTRHQCKRAVLPKLDVQALAFLLKSGQQRLGSKGWATSFAMAVLASIPDADLRQLQSQTAGEDSPTIGTPPSPLGTMPISFRRDDTCGPQEKRCTRVTYAKLEQTCGQDLVVCSSCCCTTASGLMHTSMPMRQDLCMLLVYPDDT